jgi:hypothetical protein
MRMFPRSIAVMGVVLGLGAVAVPAFAADTPTPDPQARAARSAQFEAFRACLQDQGVTLPERPADGTRPELTDEQRSAMRPAGEACASLRPERPAGRPDRPRLSEEQRTALRAQMEEHRACMETQLSAAGITRPERPADGSRPARPELTEEQRAAFAAARSACADSRPDLPGFGRRGPRGGAPAFGSTV